MFVVWRDVLVCECVLHKFSVLRGLDVGVDVGDVNLRSCACVLVGVCVWEDMNVSCEGGVRLCVDNPM